MNVRTGRWPFHYGWVIAFSGALTLFACFGLARFAFGMLLPAMRAGLGFGYDQMGFISTGNFAGYLASVALAPFLLRRFKPRLLISLGLALIAICLLGISRSHQFAVIFALYVLVGAGGGFANIPVMVLVSHWFRRERRGRAAGLMVAGNGVGIIFSGFLIPYLNRLLGEQGWRSGWLILGAISLLIALVVALLLRDDPADLGLEPVGHVRQLAETDLVPHEAPGAGRILLQLGALYAVFGATYMVYGTFIVTTLVEQFGFPEGTAGMFWSWVGFFGSFSGILFGSLSDRIGRKGGLMAVFALQTLAYLLAGSGLGTLVVQASVVLYGLGMFAIPTIMAAAVGDYLGLSRAASAFSLITFGFAIGQTIGPASAGLLAETTGSFAASYLASAALTGVAVLLAALLPKPR
ncbi:MAG: MFS transporter [Desulfuromonadaceae bacterium GWC2_58_13]|nr:MAG: MFS transporter [Desulfuromonadaceae bacterium GWC2_58_13]